MRISSIGFQIISKTNRKLVSSSLGSFLSFKKSDIQSCDYVLLSSKPKLLPANEGAEYATKYRNSTAGYRGEFCKDFNDDFVYTMTNAASVFMIKHKNSSVPKTIVGGDTREATKKYVPEIVKELSNKGIEVYVPKLDGAINGEISPVPSPILALATKNFEVPLGVLLTASHNPWKDGGYNFLTKEGMVAENKQVDEIADNFIKITRSGKLPNESKQKGKIIPFNPLELYSNYLKEKQFIDFEKIKNAGIDIFYEDFGGTGGYYFPQLLSENGIELKGLLHSGTNGPNPTMKNMVNIGNIVVNSVNPMRIGLATDGDSDRFGAVDENGKFICANDFLLLVAYHLIKNKNMVTGTIIKNHSTSEKIDALVDYFNKNENCNLEVCATPVGFKYLGGEMMRLKGTPKEAILVGEESGGLTIKGHIPEKDGFLAILELLELMAIEDKPIGQILEDVNSLLGADYKSECINVRLASEKEKNDIVNSFEQYANGKKTSLFGYDINVEKTVEHNKKIRNFKKSGDGYKIFLKNGSSILVRKSGTEPILRYFIDATSFEIYENLKNSVVNS